MWWPAIGAVAVGGVGYFFPRTMGVGYENISELLQNGLGLQALVLLGLMKFISWCVSLGSGTSGGTLAPLFTIGGCLGAAVGVATAAVAPQLGIDVRVAALVGMAAMFAGASRALLTSVVFAFETTLQPLGLLPLLGGCTASYLVSCLLMQNSIMTEKIVRRGIRAPGEYEADLFEQISVRDAASKQVVSLRADQLVGEAQAWIEAGADGASHQGFPILDDRGILVGVVTRRDLVEPRARPEQKVRDLPTRLPKYVYEDCTLRQAAEHMVRHDIGRLPVVSRTSPAKVTGMLTRSDILAAYERSLEERQLARPSIQVRLPRGQRPRTPDHAEAS
jgi:CBS domain-containing protein